MRHIQTIVMRSLGLVILSLLSMSSSADGRPLPPNSIPFTCYEFGLPDNNTWTFLDQCFSFQLNIDPFAGGLMEGMYAIVTDVIVTPTSSVAGSYYTGVAQSTVGGNNYNPQIFLRISDERSLTLNQTAPLLVINSGNTMRTYNSSTSPGSVRIMVQGYLTDNLTVNPKSNLMFEDSFE